MTTMSFVCVRDCNGCRTVWRDMWRAYAYGGMCAERAWSREASVVAGLSLSETFVINVCVTCVYNVFCVPVCFHRSTMAVVGVLECE